MKRRELDENVPGIQGPVSRGEGGVLMIQGLGSGRGVKDVHGMRHL